jgi:hypothetical protein
MMTGAEAPVIHREKKEAGAFRACHFLTHMVNGASSAISPAVSTQWV